MKEISSKYRMMVHFMVSFVLLTKILQYMRKDASILRFPFVYESIFHFNGIEV